MAYRKESHVNWCDPCQTVLANEQVEAGLCWRCGKQVRQKKLRQWFFRITRLCRGSAGSTATGSRGGLKKSSPCRRTGSGKASGPRSGFPWKRGTAPSRSSPPGRTRFSAPPSCAWRRNTPWSERLSEGTSQEKAVADFCREDVPPGPFQQDRGPLREGRGVHRRLLRQPLERAAHAGLGGQFRAHGIRHRRRHVRSGPRPAGFRFRRASTAWTWWWWWTPPRRHLDPATMTEAFAGEGIMVNSGKFDGMNSSAALEAIADHLEKEGLGKRAVSYRLKDWGISRQRYWGAPIPVIHCPECGIVPVPDEDLPDASSRGCGSSGRREVSPAGAGVLHPNHLPEMR